MADPNNSGNCTGQGSQFAGDQEPAKAWSLDDMADAKAFNDVVAEFTDASVKSNNMTVKPTDTVKQSPSPAAKAKVSSRLPTPDNAPVTLFETEESSASMFHDTRSRSIVASATSSVRATPAAFSPLPTVKTQVEKEPTITASFVESNKEATKNADVGWNTMIRKDPPKSLKVKLPSQNENLIVEDFD